MTNKIFSGKTCDTLEQPKAIYYSQTLLSECSPNGLEMHGIQNVKTSAAKHHHPNKLVENSLDATSSEVVMNTAVPSSSMSCEPDSTLDVQNQCQGLNYIFEVLVGYKNCIIDDI